MAVVAGDVGATTLPPRVVGVLRDAAAGDESDEGPAEIRCRLPIKEKGRNEPLRQGAGRWLSALGMGGSVERA